MAEENPMLEDPRYIFPPHPEAVVALSEESVSLEETIAAEEPVPDLIQQAVDGLRMELNAETEPQADE